jgi:phospholipid transport system transporter-binding protein
MASVGAVADAGKQQFGNGGELVVDFGGATEVDSSALSLMFEWQREARRRNLRISFRSLPASLESLATLYGVSELIASTA